MHLDRINFNHQFLKFRVQYYCNETQELIARHKLLTAFLICLLTPGIKNVQAIGIPFYALVNPALTFKVKFVYLFSLLIFLLAITKAQASFIKGGTFKEYLHTLPVSLHAHKTIDFILLLFSLNLVWLAIFFGGLSVFHDSSGILFLFTQSCLYVSTIFLFCTLLFNFLYKKIARAVVALFLLLLIVSISKQNNCLINLGVGISVFLWCSFIIGTTKPCFHAKKYTFKIPYLKLGKDFKFFNALKNIFIIQLAVLRKSKLSFLVRFIICFSLSLLILQVVNTQETLDNQLAFILFLMGMQTFFLSTLFALFEKEKLAHLLFHCIFPYQKHMQSIKEVILIWLGLLLAFMPVFLFCTFDLKNYCLLSLIILMSSVVLTINRVLYALSLRFCLFSALLNTATFSIIQYLFLDAYYG